MSTLQEVSDWLRELADGGDCADWVVEKHREMARLIDAHTAAKDARIKELEAAAEGARVALDSEPPEPNMEEASGPCLEPLRPGYASLGQQAQSRPFRPFRHT